MSNVNRQIILKSRPQGMADESNFSLVEAPIPPLQQGEVLIHLNYLSVDPYMRGRMRDTPSYVPPFALNHPLIGGAVGEVIESKSAKFKKGDKVLGFLNWSDYSIGKEEELHKIDPSQAPITTALGILGMPGLTAYFGLNKIGQPKKGETIVVSGAAGAVGTAVSQIAKIKGCHVVGIAGSADKLAYLRDELGVDTAINYKADDVGHALNAACHHGVDIYFDNVGGEITDHVLKKLNRHARIVICGQISMYNLDKPDIGPRPYWHLLTHSALMQGFIVYDYQSEFASGINQLTQWVKEGKLKYRENIINGLEKAPQAFIGLFKGENIGKQLVKVSDP